MVANGESIAKASKNINISRKTGERWVKQYNENGVEDFEYYDEIPETYNHPHRIIRSLSQSSESVKLNWRTFKTDDYKDMPFNISSILFHLTIY